MEGLLRSPALNPRVPGVLATGSDARSQVPLTGVEHGLSPTQFPLRVWGVGCHPSRGVFLRPALFSQPGAGLLSTWQSWM